MTQVEYATACLCKHLTGTEFFDFFQALPDGPWYVSQEGILFEELPLTGIDLVHFCEGETQEYGEENGSGEVYIRAIIFFSGKIFRHIFLINKNGETVADDVRPISDVILKLEEEEAVKVWVKAKAKEALKSKLT